MNDLVFASRRSSVRGRGGMVASSQPLATAAGLEILAQRGNAADAAVATAAALNVTEPTSTGIGGDMFALFYEAKTGAISALNGSGRLPAALSLERLRREGLPQLPPLHPYTVTVPGACAGWCDLLERHGTLGLPAVLAPAVRLAEQGFPVASITAHFWRRAAGGQLAAGLNGLEMTIDGRGPRPGEIFRNPGLARTLKAVAEGGKEAFYRGEIGEAIVAVLGEAGGCMSLEDLAAHVSTWDEPVSTSFADLRLWECPPNGQGITTLIALNILEGMSLLAMDPLSPDRLHLEIEALRLAFADARWYVADPAFLETPAVFAKRPRSAAQAAKTPGIYIRLLSKEYAAERRKLIDPRRATTDQSRGSPVAGSDTVYFCVVDRWGNACSFINSNYMGFGTGIVPSGWGFTLQNRGHNFSLEEGHPNVLAPGKRPYHTIIPAMITRDRGPWTADDGSRSTDDKPRSIVHGPSSGGDLFAALGVMGGFMQPQGHLQVFLALAQGLDPQAALDLPRFCIEDGTAGGAVALEAGIPEPVVQDLARRGHGVRSVTGWERALFGRGQIILREAETGILTSGSDARADGCAMTLI